MGFDAPKKRDPVLPAPEMLARDVHDQIGELRNVRGCLDQAKAIGQARHDCGGIGRMIVPPFVDEFIKSHFPSPP